MLIWSSKALCILFLKDLSSNERMKIFSIYLYTWPEDYRASCVGLGTFLSFWFFSLFLVLDLSALHHPHKKTEETVNLSFGCLHWTVQTESANCAEAFSLWLPLWKMLNITLLFISFFYQCQAVYSATRAPYVAQMTHFKSPYFNLCTLSLPLAVCTAMTLGAVTNGKLNLDHLRANLSHGGIKWASLINSCAQWLSSGG